DGIRDRNVTGVQTCALPIFSNIDPSDAGETLADLDPETTLFIVASKSFGTQETLTNARLARAWLWERLSAAGVISDDDEAARAQIGRASCREREQGVGGRGA